MKKISLFTLIVALVSLFYACGNNAGVSEPGQYSKVYMPRAANTPDVNSLIISDTVYTFPYNAYLGGTELSDNDIQVSFGVDTAAVDSFNIENGTDYLLMPEGSYTIGTKDAVIPSGQRSTDSLTVSVNANSSFLESQTYLLPLSITEIEGPTGSVNKSLKTTYFIIEPTYADIDRSNWKIVGVDSYQNPDTSPDKTLDGNDESYWHTPWVPPRPTSPYYISVDMGEEQKVHGFQIVGRIGKSEFTSQGNPIDIVTKVSNDTTNWGKGEDFTLPFDVNNVRTSVYFSSPMEGRYFKIIVNSTFLDKKFTHIAELYAF